MTRAKKTDDVFSDDDFAFDPNAVDDNPFADIDPGDDDDDIFATGPSTHGTPADDDPFGDEWADLPGSPSETIAHDLILKALREDPFATVNLDDCLPAEGITPTALSRYARASAAYLAACHSPCQDDEQQEILRRTAAYWLRKSKAFWIEEW